MKTGRANNVLVGLGVLALIIILFPSVKPVVDSLMTIVVGLTPSAGAFAHFILNNASYWGLGIAIFVAFYIILRRD